MASDLRARLAALESWRSVARFGGVVLMRDGESPQQAIARSGRKGGLIVMPPVLDASVWETETAGMQRRLMQRAVIVIAGGVDPGS